jgi:hypothetical protein
MFAHIILVRNVYGPPGATQAGRFFVDGYVLERGADDWSAPRTQVEQTSLDFPQFCWGIRTPFTVEPWGKREWSGS